MLQCYNYVLGTPIRNKKAIRVLSYSAYENSLIGQNTPVLLCFHTLDDTQQREYFQKEYSQTKSFEARI